MLNVKKVLCIMLLVVIALNMCYSCFAIALPENTDLVGDNKADGVIDSAKKVWLTIANVVQILAVAAVVFAGLRYMFASADAKADIKKQTIILVVGATLVFSALKVLEVIRTAAEKVI